MTAELGAPRWPSIRPYIQRTLDTARAGLDGARFNDAWSSGTSFSVEQAVTLAMSV
ncbi:MAG TPA: hypothetical protein VFB50_21560 [Chloroflexota bacterium]|nr:hypothetical protein [Chloroflexota bacterium]